MSPLLRDVVYSMLLEGSSREELLKREVEMRRIEEGELEWSYKRYMWESSVIDESKKEG